MTKILQGIAALKVILMNKLEISSHVYLEYKQGGFLGTLEMACVPKHAPDYHQSNNINVRTKLQYVIYQMYIKSSDQYA